ncbi:alpha/beta hydrolase [Pseudoxanthomonas broegbernensis]|nr:alpha/beta hydrolase-fold protein [Pseudoxanthomonas broegbernensis]MBB6066249.1 hypothetical protein [Pseudoxanthomonas broegbernensis]
MFLRRLALPLALLLGCAAAGPVMARQGAAPEGVAATIADARQFDLQSAQGHAYRIFVAAPQGEAPAAGYPVIYLLDGNSVFGTAVETVRLQRAALGPAVIVAVGYPVGTPFDGPARFRDYTPPTDPRHIPEKFDRSVVTGGQDAFLDFLVAQVRPLVESLHPIDPHRQALFGHSLGGLFVLHTMFTRPELFQKYVAGSPSIWWNGRSVLAELDRFAALPSAARRDVGLMVVVGGEELGHIVLDARDLITRLPPIRDRYLEVAGEGHVSVLPTAINEGLRFALGSGH